MSEQDKRKKADPEMDGNRSKKLMNVIGGMLGSAGGKIKTRSERLEEEERKAMGEPAKYADGGMVKKKGGSSCGHSKIAPAHRDAPFKAK